MINIRNYKITSLCLCTIIGAGFATGRELLTYFCAYGKTGFFTLLLASILFAILIKKIMNLPYKNIEELVEGKVFGFLLSKLTLIFLIVLYGGMLSAGGELMGELVGINKFWGIVATAIASVIIIGTGSLEDMSQVVFIPMILIIGAIAITTTEHKIGIPSPTIITPKAIISPIIYVSYNMLTTIPLLLTIPDKYMYRNCGGQVGAVIFLLSSMLMLPLYTHYGDISDKALPLMTLVTGNMSWIYKLFMVLAVITTAVSCGYSVCKQKPFSSFKNMLSVFIVTVISICVAMIGFVNIVNKIYALFGIVGIGLLWYVLRAKKEDII